MLLAYPILFLNDFQVEIVQFENIENKKLFFQWKRYFFWMIQQIEIIVFYVYHKHKIFNFQLSIQRIIAL